MGAFVILDWRLGILDSIPRKSKIQNPKSKIQNGTALNYLEYDMPPSLDNYSSVDAFACIVRP